MGFLKRIFGGSADTDAHPGAPQAPPILFAIPSGRPYADITCPHCGVRMDPIPRAKRNCRACGEAVYVRSGEFGVGRILGRDDTADPNEEEEYRARQEYAGRPVRPRHLREFRKAQLRRAAALDVRLAIEARDVDRTCSACRALEGHEYTPSEAPVLPYDRCTASFICDCAYLWTLPEVPPAPPIDQGALTG